MQAVASPPAAPKSFLDRRPVLTFWAIFALGFGVRLAILTQVPAVPVMGEAGNIAHAIFTRHAFADPYAIPTGPTAHSNPFYPALVACLFWIFGENAVGGLARCVVLIAAYSVLYALFPALAARVGMPRLAGVIAGVTAALVPVKRSVEVFRGWEDPFAALALAGLMLLFLRQSENRSIRGWLLLGSSVGAALYISASLAPVVAAWAVLDLVEHFNRKRLEGWILSAAVALMVISPWLIRDRLVLGHWVFMRDVFGLALRYANHDGASPSDEWFTSYPSSFKLTPAYDRAEAELVRQMGEVAYNQREMQLFRQWTSQHPRQFAFLTLQHFFYFWFGPPEHPLEFVFTIAYTLLGFWGLLLLRRYCGGVVFRMWCGALITYPVMYYFVVIVSRYRVPIDWMVWLPAGLVIADLINRRHESRASSKGATTPAS